MLGLITTALAHPVESRGTHAAHVHKAIENQKYSIIDRRECLIETEKNALSLDELCDDT